MGNFRGQHFDSDIPPRKYYQNADICKQYVEFIARDLCRDLHQVQSDC